MCPFGGHLSPCFTFYHILCWPFALSPPIPRAPPHSFSIKGHSLQRTRGAQAVPALLACPGGQHVAGADVDWQLNPQEHMWGCLSRWGWWRKAYLETQRRTIEDGREDPRGGGSQRSRPFPVVWKDWGLLLVGKFTSEPGVCPLPTVCHIPMSFSLDTGAGERWANREKRGRSWASRAQEGPMAGLQCMLRDKVRAPRGFRDGVGSWGGGSWDNIRRAHSRLPSVQWVPILSSMSTSFWYPQIWCLSHDWHYFYLLFMLIISRK